MACLSKTYNDEENVVASHVEHSVDNGSESVGGCQWRLGVGI